RRIGVRRDGTRVQRDDVGDRRGAHCPEASAKDTVDVPARAVSERGREVQAPVRTDVELARADAQRLAPRGDTGATRGTHLTCTYIRRHVAECRCLSSDGQIFASLVKRIIKQDAS